MPTKDGRENDNDRRMHNERSEKGRFINSTNSYAKRAVKYIPGHGISRYDNALRNLIPLRPKARTKDVMGINSAGLFSIIYSTWLTKYMWKAYQKGLGVDELPVVATNDSSAYNAQRLEILWNDELSRKGSDAASFGLVVWRFVRTRILVSCLIIFFTQILGFLSNTLLMRSVLEHIEIQEEGFWHGFTWVVLFGLFDLIRALLFSWSWMINYRTALRLRAACLTLLYRKIISVNSLGRKTTGELINIFAVDGQKVADVIIYGPMIVGGPVITVCAVIVILKWLSPIALLGIAVFMLFYPIQYLLSRLISHYKLKATQITDARIQSTTEVLSCIKQIKMYAWEKHFSEDILNIRDREKKMLWLTACMNSFGTALSPTVPVMSVIVTFLSHLSMGYNLTAAVAFPIATFCIVSLRNSLIRCRDSVRVLADALISFGRMKSVLLLEDNTCHIIKPIVRSQVLAIVNGRFVCDVYEKPADETKQSNAKKKVIDERNSTKAEKMILNPTQDLKRLELLADITFEASKGKLVGICGHVGSGKTSLLLAALGQLKMTAGQLMKEGSCAFVSQEAWIVNATFKENVLFGEAFDPKRYYRTLSICSLKEDIDTFPGGDDTEIGERGINLSGGQKQRVALARAFYANRDIYFLDDPLSAVDAHVGLHIFEDLILDALCEKTVLFVTHQVQYLSRCDDIYMLRNGRIVEHGTHDELMRADREYASTVKNSSLESQNRFIDDEVLSNSSDQPDGLRLRKEISKSDNPKTFDKANGTDGHFMQQDKIETGGIKATAYRTYITAGGGYFIALLTLMAFCFHAGSGVFSSWWLTLWLKEGSGGTVQLVGNETVISNNINDNPNFEYYRDVYGFCVVLILLGSIVRGLVLCSATVKASVTLHNSILKKLISSPIHFFDTTPVGRIQNLLSREVDEVDNRLPITLESALQCVFSCIFTFSTVIVSLPWFLIPSSILGCIFFYVGRIYRGALRNFKRMEGSLRSPVFGFVTTTTQGLSTIRAFKKEADFVQKFQELLDSNNGCQFMCDVAMRWLSARLDTLTALCTCAAAFLVIVLKGQMAPALAGLAMAFAAQMTGTFQYSIRVLSEVEVRFISVEKMCYYLRTLIGESYGKAITVVPPIEWPINGSIDFVDVQLKYNVNADVALDDVSFDVAGGEKIGIVGRTGSGKSTLVVALFRLYELSGGKIKIDGIDISKIHLETLRNQLTIIPQDPILFSGTIRYYLDPMKQHSDTDIWNALDRTHLKDRIALNPAQLGARIELGGKNFSMGERQLLCLARALLRRSKILILDEATASVDPETETQVHLTIQKEFSNCTVLIIAHRLHAVMSCNRILVMEKGRVAEFDTPANLLSNPDSKFSAMISSAEEAAKNL